MVSNVGKLTQNMEKILNRTEGMKASRGDVIEEEHTLNFSQKRRRLKKFLEKD